MCSRYFNIVYKSTCSYKTQVLKVQANNEHR
ncbi:hypothetical protein SSP1935 [Staphylococcus saprophyticus subsp. saprophyticus ATCC 15305]|uniref:Uncharacterized protein n=1 Tax=Staphylococcus saprophyticus subsp. saprophyticus (strain ATCC 15305 / DSM 20229 / NCIMB 8711 / NCTC 7292 / S-41) TaxID=342451 RepID=Q49VY0_STAS1|nr:hypothetical protein SSP1935 [Staphylococcus saprophyticus subsp. saprophyticus ATCC 15305] [Staphylococcus saprophyticus subsp. saprophyticus ATCC 15305 = NCTC 7292]